MAELDDALSGSRRYALEELRGKLYRDQGIDYVPGYRRGSFDDSPTAESVSREESQGHATARSLKNVEKEMEDQNYIKKNEDYPRIRGPQKISMTIEHPSSSEPPAGAPREMIGRIKEGARDIRRGTQHLPWNRQDVFGGAAKIATAPFTVAADQVGMLLEAVTRGLITKDQFETALAALRGAPISPTSKYEAWLEQLPTALKKGEKDSLAATIKRVEARNAETAAKLKVLEDFEKRLPELRRQGVTPLFDPDKLMKEPRTFENALREQKDPNNNIGKFLGIEKPTAGEQRDQTASIIENLRRRGSEPRQALMDFASQMERKYGVPGQKRWQPTDLRPDELETFKKLRLGAGMNIDDLSPERLSALSRALRGLPAPSIVDETTRGGMQQNPALVEQRQRLQEALPQFGERIGEAAVKLNGKVYTGPTHGSALLNGQTDLVDNFGKSWADAEDTPLEWGWTTKSGKFVSSQEALQIAKSAGQMPKDYQSDVGLESHAFRKQGLPDFTSKAVKVPPEDQPLQRSVIRRDRSGRPLETRRLPSTSDLIDSIRTNQNRNRELENSRSFLTLDEVERARQELALTIQLERKLISKEQFEAAIRNLYR